MLVEFAVIVTLLALIFLSIFQVAMLYNAWHVTRYAAYCAARAYAMGGSGEAAHRAAALAMMPVSAPVQGLFIEKEGARPPAPEDDLEAVRRVAGHLDEELGLSGNYPPALTFIGRKDDFFLDEMETRYRGAFARTSVELDAPWMERNEGYVRVAVQHEAAVFDPFLRLLAHFRESPDPDLFPEGTFALKAFYVMRRH